MVTTKPKLKGPPPDMEVPQEIVLKRSGVDPERIGIWCKSHIPCGKKFGPFMGNKVQEATDDMDPTYVWEIVDLETKEFLFYIDATNEKEGNWMRYINCARFFEEQNIVSEQEGVDIIYRAIKDIYPEQELLTWYEKAPLRKRKGRRIKRAPKAEVTESSCPPSSGSIVDSEFSSHSTSDMTSESSKGGQVSGQSMDTDTQRKVDNDSSELHVSQRGRRCKVTKYWEMEADFSEDDSDVEMMVKTHDSKKSENGNSSHQVTSAGDEEWSVNGAERENHCKSMPHLSSEILSELAHDPREYYQFEMKPYHIVKNRIGRKLFQCDICSSVYRHSFSLKRHYVRNHLNYKYVSPTDLINCCVPLKSIPPTIQAELRKHVKQEPGSDSLSTGTHKDAVLDDNASEENYPEKVVHDKHSDMTSSPSMGSLASVTRDDLADERSKCISEDMSVHSSETVTEEHDKTNQQEMRDDDDDDDKMDCYDGDTEIEQDSSDNEDHNDAHNASAEKNKPSIMSPILQREQTPDSTVVEKVKCEPCCSHADGGGKSSEVSTDSGLHESVGAKQCLAGKDGSLFVSSVGNDEKSPGGRKCEKAVNDNKCAPPVMKGGDSKSGNVDTSSGAIATNNTICDGVLGESVNSEKKPSSVNQDNGCIHHGDVKEPKSTSCSESVKTREHGNDTDAGLGQEDGTVANADVKAAHPDVPLNGKGEPMFGLFRCNVCEKVFDTISHLKQHLANHPVVADGRQTFACEKCEMKFAHKQNLMRHQAVHTGARPYICSYCDKKFPTSTNLRRHEKVHQARKFSCHHCHSVFTQTGDLKKHIHNIHPELFHECGFCTRYFIKKRLLLDHLRETHDGKTMDDNCVEIEAKQDAFQYDLHLDRAESMRLAITHGRNKPGPRFACTVCRKKFHDYISMCRHRRLAHQRPIFVAPIMDENGDIVDDAVQHYINPCKHGFYDPEDEEQAVFYASIANVIADNLQNCIEGREEQLKEVTPLVKWKNKNTLNAVNSKSESDAKSAKVIAESIVYNLQEFNFPKDFKLKNSNNCYRTVPYSSDGRISWKNKKAMSERKRTESMNEQGQVKVTSSPRKDISVSSQSSTGTSSALLQFLQNDITSMPQTMTSTSILARAELSSPRYDDSSLPALPPLLKKPKLEVVDMPIDFDKSSKSLPIRVPQVKSCRICRCLFHNHSLFQQHMFNKHGISIENDGGEVGENCASSVSSVNLMPKPAHLNSSPASMRNDSATLNGHAPMCQPIKIKTELPWDEPPVLTEITNDVSDVSQAAGSNMGPPDNLDLIGNFQPLDLSKKSHLAGYKLTNRGGKQPDDGGNDENDDSTQPRDETDTKAEEKCHQTGAKFICGACRGRYNTHEELLVHQENDHPNVTCTYTQLEEEVAATLLATPNPIGILNVCSTQLPPVTTSPKRTNKLSCTKCSKMFQCMADLHRHIADCAEPYVPKMMFVYYYPGAKNRHFFLPGAKGEMLKVKKGQKYRRNATEAKKANNTSTNVTQNAAQQEGVISEDSQNNLPKQNGLDELFVDQMLNGKKKRRRNYELLYNPHRHIRRREMAEIIDTPKCFGCNGLFSTISLLERHIPMCRHKDKIQDQAAKEAEATPEMEEDEDDENAYDPNKHMCIYCQKQFTYFGMLRKHVFDVCAVRADLVERGEYIDEEWERDINTRAGQAGGIQSRTLSRQSSMSSLNGGDSVENGDNSTSSKLPRSGTRGRRRRRGNGWYRGKEKKKESNTGGEWEKYFVLDETFMGIYNSVVRTDDEDDNDEDGGSNEKDADKCSMTGTVDSNGESSIQSARSLVTAKANDYNQPISNQSSQPQDYLEEMQQKKQALFAELTKPIDGNEMAEKESMSLLRFKQRDVSTPEISGKKPKGKGDRQMRVDEKCDKASPMKKDAMQKAKFKLSSADNLANVKQKLARKIRENKRLHGNGANTRDGKSPYLSLKLDKSPVKSPKKSPRKDVVETKSQNQKAKTKSPLKLSVSGQKPVQVFQIDEVKADVSKAEPKAAGISGIHKVKKLKPKLEKLDGNHSGTLMTGEEFMSLGEIVNRYTKDNSKCPKLFLGRPAKKHVEVENEDFEDHVTVDEVINNVVRGQRSRAGGNANAPIELTDSSDEDEDNIKLSELAKVNRNVRSAPLVQDGSTMAQSPKKIPVRSKNACNVTVTNNKTKANAASLKFVKRQNDNGFGHSLDKHKSPKGIHKKKIDLGDLESYNAGSVGAVTSLDGSNKLSRTSELVHHRANSDSILNLNEVNRKLKECSRKRPRSLESASAVSGKKAKVDISQEALKSLDSKSWPKKVKT